MSTTTLNNIAGLLDALRAEMATLRAERDDYRQRWLKQVDVNDQLRGRLAESAASTEAWESLGRE